MTDLGATRVGSRRQSFSTSEQELFDISLRLNGVANRITRALRDENWKDWEELEQRARGAERCAADIRALIEQERKYDRQN